VSQSGKNYRLKELPGLQTPPGFRATSKGGASSNGSKKNLLSTVQKYSSRAKKRRPVMASKKGSKDDQFLADAKRQPERPLIEVKEIGENLGKSTSKRIQRKNSPRKLSLRWDIAAGSTTQVIPPQPYHDLAFSTTPQTRTQKPRQNTTARVLKIEGQGFWGEAPVETRRPHPNGRVLAPSGPEEN